MNIKLCKEEQMRECAQRGRWLKRKTVVKTGGGVSLKGQNNFLYKSRTKMRTKQSKRVKDYVRR